MIHEDNNIEQENDNVSIEIKDISKNNNLSINGLSSSKLKRVHSYNHLNQTHTFDFKFKWCE